MSAILYGSKAVAHSQAAFMVSQRFFQLQQLRKRLSSAAGHVIKEDSLAFVTVHIETSRITGMRYD
jgi:hypothetical protein